MPDKKPTRYQVVRARGLCGSCASNKAEPGLARCRPCMDQTKATRDTLAAAGLCVCCKKPAIEGQTNCADCASFEAKRTRLGRQERRAAGLCTECGEKARRGKKLCRRCAKLGSKRNSAFRKKCKEEGLCIKCGKMALMGMTLCVECRDKRLAYFRSYKRDQRQNHKERREARRAAGLCPKCGKEPPAPNRKACDDCLKANLVSCKLRRIKKQEAAAAAALRQNSNQGPVAQQIEQSPPKAKVAGANPAGIIA